jgi:class 3 adenylate cyclase
MSGGTPRNTDEFGISPLSGSTADMVHVEMTFLCADVVHFTAMTQRLGDPTSFRLMRRVARLVQAEAKRREGVVAEVRGDSFLLGLPRPPAAVECALAIHRALEEDAERQADGGVQVRMAVHTGRAIRIHDQFFGLSMILPFRLLALVEPGQIAITAEALARTSELPWPANSPRTFHPKGFQEEVAFTLLDLKERAPDVCNRGRAPERNRDCAWPPGLQIAASAP